MNVEVDLPARHCCGGTTKQPHIIGCEYTKAVNLLVGLLRSSNDAVVCCWPFGRPSPCAYAFGHWWTGVIIMNTEY
jgi:hypothetical protein